MERACSLGNFRYLAIEQNHFLCTWSSISTFWEDLILPNDAPLSAPTARHFAPPFQHPCKGDHRLSLPAGCIHMGRHFAKWRHLFELLHLLLLTLPAVRRQGLSLIMIAEYFHRYIHHSLLRMLRGQRYPPPHPIPSWFRGLRGQVPPLPGAVAWMSPTLLPSSCTPLHHHF